MSELHSIPLLHPSAFASSAFDDFPGCESEIRAGVEAVAVYRADWGTSDRDGFDAHESASVLPAFEAANSDALQDGEAGAAASPYARPADMGVSADDRQLALWIVRVAELRDQAALRSLYDASVTRVHSLVLRLLRRPAWAEEVVEDTYFQVWRQALRFDPARGRAGGWLMAMARSRAIDAWRREARFDHASLDCDEALDMPQGGPCHDDLLDFSRSHELLHIAIASLPAQRRQLVALAFLRGCSHEEIALYMALPLGTVKSQIRRALASLRETLCNELRPGSVGGISAI